MYELSKERSGGALTLASQILLNACSMGRLAGCKTPLLMGWAVLLGQLIGSNANDKIVQRFGFGLMSLFHNLRLRFSPPRIDDADFGSLLFMHIPRFPERSYWEGEWSFFPTGTLVSIGLPGGEDGPLPESRQFYLGLPARFDQIMASARPKLAAVFETWFERELPADVSTVLKLSGFGLENPKVQPLLWDISFETTGPKWLGITISFRGDVPQDAVVDT